MTRRSASAAPLAAVFLALLLAAAAPAFAADLALIDKQAWRIDPTAGTPAPGHEREFEETRQDFHSFIEVYLVYSDSKLTAFLFAAEDEFLITNLTAKVSKGDNGWFTVEMPKLTPDADNISEYFVKDADTLLFRRKSGTYVYKRIPDFNPPRDELTGIYPLLWQK